jgi:Secretion system C-terminal sorting domain
MKRILLAFSAILILGSASVKAQLPNGSLAPDFTATDINGVEHHLYDYLAQGYTVVLDVSATWCGPCWSYHTGAYNGTNGEGALHVLHNEHGVANGGNVIVIMIEGDGNTNTECLYSATGCNSSTQGDWVTDTPYPIIDNAGIANAYQISYFPTIYTICPTGIVTETSQITAADHYAFIEANTCQTVASNDGMLFNYSGTELTCDDADIIIDLVNLGSEPLTSANIMVTGVDPIIDFDWTGNLDHFESETVNLGTSSVVDGENVVITITNNDDNLLNNVISLNIGATVSTTHIHIDMLTDMYPGDVSWVIYDENMAAVASGGPYGEFDVQLDPVLLNEDIYLPETGCYNFVLSDQFGDGFYPGAYINVYGVTSGGAAMDNILQIGIEGLSFSETNGAAKVNELVGVIENEMVSVLNAYPNPTSDILNIEYSVVEAGAVKLEVINLLGETVMVQNLGTRSIGANVDRMDMSALNAGVYMINLVSNGNTSSFRVTVQ